MNKDKFSEYLSKTVKAVTVKNYLNTLDDVYEKYHELISPYNSILEINNADEFKGIVAKIKADPEYKDWNFHKNEVTQKQDGKNGFPNAALNRYLKFLSGDDEAIEKREINRKQVAHEDINESHNLIYFGAPGTGKSHTIKNNISLIINEENQEKYYERVTFHPDYSYANFVGTYKPVPEGNEITYKYVPGPFMRVYKKAIMDKEHNYLLIIEEINRADVAAVFGDVFQLLDRKSDNSSEYKVHASEDVIKYLNAFEANTESKEDITTLSIPSNMYIWATMNSADQGVFPMDTAFKRRWNFLYLDIDNNESEISDFEYYLGRKDNTAINWNKLRKAINEQLLSYNINEDKLMGPFFISNDKLESMDSDGFNKIFKNKVLMYLFDDAAKQKRNELFSGCSELDRKQFSKICKAFDEKGIEIFTSEIVSKFKKDE